MMKESVESYMKTHGESLLRHQQLAKLLSSGERIKFDVECGSTAAMEE